MNDMVTNISTHSTGIDAVDWSVLPRAVTYQLRTPDGWVSVTRTTYAAISNPQNRRILLRDEQKIINSELIKI